MRGTVGDPYIDASGGRITPAHAGNSPRLPVTFRLKRDHPRSCGEQCGPSEPGLRREGSPPLMRGTAQIGNKRNFDAGITPAHAGNRHLHTGHGFLTGDHPRSCGEQSIRKVYFLHIEGSPPLMRGTAQSVTAAAATARITPAHAGNRWRNV